MPKLLNLRCHKCDHAVEDVFFKQMDAPLPDCEACGAVMAVDWRGVRPPATKAFRRVWHEGRGWIESQNELDRTRTIVAKNLGVPVSDIVLHEPTRQEMKAKGDDHKHRAWENRRKAGIDDTQLSELRADAKRKKFNPPKKAAP